MLWEPRASGCFVDLSVNDHISKRILAGLPGLNAYLSYHGLYSTAEKWKIYGVLIYQRASPEPKVVYWNPQITPQALWFSIRLALDFVSETQKSYYGNGFRLIQSMRDSHFSTDSLQLAPPTAPHSHPFAMAKMIGYDLPCYLALRLEHI